MTEPTPLPSTVVDLREKFRDLSKQTAEKTPPPGVLGEIRLKIFYLASEVEPRSPPAAMLLRAVAASIVDAESGDAPESHSHYGSAEQLGTMLLDEEVGIAVKRVADRFDMSERELAQSVGSGLDEPSGVKSHKTAVRLREMLEIIGRVSGWAGGERQAMAWYRSQPIAALGGRTAESLVKSGEATAVRDYLDHIAVGGYA